MKTNPNDPISPKTDAVYNGKEGLTKREHFAGIAMQGYLAGDPANENQTVLQTAQWSVKVADALIAELSRTQD